MYQLANGGLEQALPKELGRGWDNWIPLPESFHIGPAQRQNKQNY